MSPPSTLSPAALRQAWDDLTTRSPATDVRRAAARLEVAEAQLLATRCGDGVRRLEVDVARLLPRLAALGALEAVTRNHLFVHQKAGVYESVYANPHVSSVVGDGIDLRIFPARWAHGFAVDAPERGGPGPSLRFFDAHGAAVHEIFLGEDSNPDAWEALVLDFLHPDQSPGQEVAPAEEPSGTRPDHEVDVGALEAAWRAMKDTHDFFGILREHRVDRAQALRLVSRELARPVEEDGVRRILGASSRDGVELMVFVRSPGTIQIHHGPVCRVVDDPPWLHVRDPGFDLAVREGGIAQAWVVRKPVERGWVTSLEVFDARATLCAHLFGVRKEGEPEDPAWRELARGLPQGTPPGG